MVEYFGMPETPAVTYFRCEKLRATLPVEHCGMMWKQANHKKDERRWACRCCPIGAVHAGETAASLSPFKGALICGRCHRPASRLVGKHLCVSCKNREYELLKGRNAKGSAPVKLKALVPRTMRYLHGNEIRTLHLPLSLNIEELMVAALRDSQNRVRFFFDGASQFNFRQLRIF
jgi:hypothetical protein